MIIFWMAVTDDDNVLKEATSKLTRGDSSNSGAGLYGSMNSFADAIVAENNSNDHNSKSSHHKHTSSNMSFESVHEVSESDLGLEPVIEKPVKGSPKKQKQQETLSAAETVPDSDDKDDEEMTHRKDEEQVTKPPVSCCVIS